METLAPRESYDRDELGVSDRLPLYSGTLFGLFMAMFKFMEHARENGAWFALGLALTVGVGSGAVYGLLFPWALRRVVKRLNDRIYAGDPRAVPEPPAGYSYRLPCSWIAKPFRGVFGVLYLGPEGLHFDPLRRAPSRFRRGFDLGPLQTVAMERVEIPLPRFYRLWGRSRLPHISIRSDSGRALFIIPATDATFPRLMDALQALKHQHDGAAHAVGW